MTIDRSLVITTDGDDISFSGRIRLTGEDELSMFPSLFTLNAWNLPEEAALRISRCRNISVSHGDACLVSGTVSDVYRRAVPEGILTTVSISLGLELWESIISLAVAAGKTVSESIGLILNASGTGVSLLTYSWDDPVLSRGHSYLGRASECIESVASVIHGRAMLTPSGVMIVPSGGLPEHYRIDKDDLIDIPSFVDSGRIMVLYATVAGWRPGQTVLVSYNDIQARGIIRNRSVNADTSTGPWSTEMIVEVL